MYYNGSKTDLTEQIIAQEYVKSAISAVLQHLIPAFRELVVKNLISLTEKIYDDETLRFFGWKCLECNMLVEGEKHIIEQIISDHHSETGHNNGKWIKYNENDDSKLVGVRRRKYHTEFHFDHNINRKIKLAFDNIYPLLGYEFNRIVEKLPDDTESYKRFTASLVDKWKKQEGCKHDFAHRQPAMTLYGYYGMACIKCGRIRRVKASKVKGLFRSV
jgi:hypothetical protein